MYPTYDSIVDNLCRVQKDIVFYEQVASAGPAFESGFVRIVDIAGSPPQLTDKEVAGRYVPAGEKDIHESTHSG
jgi:hypothetical protein